MSRKQCWIKTWIKTWLICAFLACAPLLYAYANFRAVRGEVFFRAINSKPGLLYARILKTWGMEISGASRGQVYTFRKTVRINQKNLWAYAHRFSIS